MKESARKVFWYFQIYKMYLEDNGLDNDSNSLSVADLINFVENEISSEERDDYLQRVS